MTPVLTNYVQDSTEKIGSSITISAPLANTLDTPGQKK